MAKERRNSRNSKEHKMTPQQAGRLGGLRKNKHDVESGNVEV